MADKIFTRLAKKILMFSHLHSHLFCLIVWALQRIFLQIVEVESLVGSHLPLRTSSRPEVGALRPLPYLKTGRGVGEREEGGRKSERREEWNG